MEAMQTPHRRPENPRTVVLVEGRSDQVAVETLAACLGRNLADEGVAVMPTGGAHAMRRVLANLDPPAATTRLAGLYDIGEERVVRRALEEVGFGNERPLTRGGLEELGFYVCDTDLEDELIRALGAEAVVAVIREQGELGSFRTLQKEPAWRGRPREHQLRRFLGNGGRKRTYARLLVEALDPATAPRPLRLLLQRV